MWQLVNRFFLRTTVIPDNDQLIRIVQQQRPSEEQLAIIQSYLDELVQMEPVDEARFRIEAEMLREYVLDERFNDLLMKVSEIQNTGAVVGKNRIAGRVQAIRYFMSAAPGMLADTTEENLDVVLEGKAILDEHQAASEGMSDRVMTYLSEIDNIQFGMQPGEMHLVAGYTGEGKSIYCINVAHAAVVKQGRNVLYLTTETPPPVVRRRFFVRHSCEQGKFPNGPLSYRGLKHGRLTKDELDLARTVSTDLQTNEQYGKLFVNFLPSTMPQVETMLLELNAAWPISMIIIDYLGLMNSSRPAKSSMENLKAVLIEAKRMAVSFDGGRGIILLSPWQMSREAWKAATISGFYGKASLAETSEAEKSSDGVMSLLRTENGLTCVFTKLRDEDSGAPFTLQCDFDHILIRSSGETVRTRF